MKNIFAKIFILPALLIWGLSAFAEEEIVPKNITKPSTIWDEYDSNFLGDIEGKDNERLRKAQEIMDTDIEHKLQISLEYTNLKQCLEQALEYNYKIKISDDIRRTKFWNYRNSQAKFLPDLYYQYQIQHVEGQFLVGTVLLEHLEENPVSNTFNVGWYNANFPKMYFNMQTSKEIYKASYYTFQFTKEQTILFTSLEYYNLLDRKLQIEVLRINLQEREQQLKMTQGRYMLGVGTKFDVLRAEAQVAAAQQEYIAAYNNLRLNQAKLANIMGIEILEPIYPYEMNIDRVDTLGRGCKIEYLYDVALKSRQDIKSQQRQIAALKAQKKSIYMDYAPVLTLNYAHQEVGTLGDPLRPNDTLGAFATIYLGQNLGVGTYTNLKSYDAQISEQINRLTQLQRDIKESVLNSFYNSMTSYDRVEAAKKGVAAGDEGLKNALVRWEIGENTFLDVIQAQSTKTLARQELISAVIEYNKAQVQLLFDAGIITVKAVLTNYPMSEPNNPNNIIE